MKDFINGFAHDNSLPLVVLRFALIAGLGALASSQKPYKHLPKGEFREFVKKYSPRRYLQGEGFTDGWFKKNLNLSNEQLYKSVSNIAMSPFIRSCLESYVTNAIAERTGAPLSTELVAGMISNGLVVYLDVPDASSIDNQKKRSLSEEDAIKMLQQMPTTVLLNSMVSYNVIGVFGSAAFKVCLDLYDNAKKAKSKDGAQIDLYSDANMYAYKCVAISTGLNLAFMLTGFNENKIVCDVVRKAIDEMVEVYTPKPVQYKDLGSGLKTF